MKVQRHINEQRNENNIKRHQLQYFNSNENTQQSDWSQPEVVASLGKPQFLHTYKKCIYIQ